MIALERLYSEDVTTERKLDSGDIERRTRKQSIPFIDIIARLDPSHPSIDLLKDIVWVGLLDEDPDLTPEDTELLIKYEFKKLAYVVEQVDKAVAQSLDIDRDELIRKRTELETDGKEEETTKNDLGTGKNSKNSDVASSD